MGIIDVEQSRDFGRGFQCGLLCEAVWVLTSREADVLQSSWPHSSTDEYRHFCLGWGAANVAGTWCIGGRVTCLTFVFLVQTYEMPSIFYLKSNRLWLFMTLGLYSKKFTSGSALNILQWIMTLQLYPGIKEIQFNAHRLGHLFSEM